MKNKQFPANELKLRFIEAKRVSGLGRRGAELSPQKLMIYCNHCRTKQGLTKSDCSHQCTLGHYVVGLLVLLFTRIMFSSDERI